MTGFCGWIGNAPANSEPTATLSNMAAALQQSANSIESIVHPNGGISASRRFHDRNGNTHAAFSGTPHWPQSARRADDAGSNAAHWLLDNIDVDGAGLSRYPGGACALAITAFDDDRAILATDRFGIRPLYYAHFDDGSLAFASEIACLLMHPKISGELDAQSLFDFLYFHMIPSPATVYQGIAKLEPGHTIAYDRGRITVERHWQPTFVDSGHAGPACRAELQNTLRQAVQRCAGQSNDKVGAFLSGGLDSSTVSGMLADIQEGETHAYSIGFEQEGFDEMAYARIAAKHFGLRLHEYYVTPSDVADAIPIIASAYREPFGNSSAVPTFFCARLARDDGVDLLLAGDGGDELFAGNERYAKQKLFAVYDRLPERLKQRVLPRLFAVGSPLSRVWPLGKVASYIDQASVPMPRRMQTYNFVQRTPLHEIFDANFTAAVDTERPYTELERVWLQNDSKSLVNRMLFFDWKFTLADNDLQKVSRMCEHAGIDVAYPMLDDALADLSLRVPPGAKLRFLQLRHFYKRAMRDFLPGEIINKSKHGFGLPFGYWLEGSAKLQRIVFGSLEALQARAIFHRDFIATLLDSHRTGHAGFFGEMIWVLTILEQWLEHHRDKTSRELRRA